MHEGVRVAQMASPEGRGHERNHPSEELDHFLATPLPVKVPHVG